MALASARDKMSFIHYQIIRCLMSVPTQRPHRPQLPPSSIRLISRHLEDSRYHSN